MSTYCAGAIHLTCTTINITANATLLLSGNSVTHPHGEGGAMHITGSHLIISGATLHANNNRASHGGTMLLRFTTMSISNFALVSCISNKASFAGGATFSNSYISVNDNSRVVFYNNSAIKGVFFIYNMHLFRL